ncbi:MAG TPA: hypothetical protein VGO72_08130 [Herminiimonas sp.]|nr:hypothetical protein [Herminiimonas sp.]
MFKPMRKAALATRFGGFEAEELLSDDDCLEAMQVGIREKYPRHYSGLPEAGKLMPAKQH